MILIIDKDKSGAEAHSVTFEKEIKTIEDLYHNFDALKLLMGVDDAVLVVEEMIDIIIKFPFDIVFLLSAPFGENPATYVDTSKFKTISWTEFVNVNSVKDKIDENVRDIEENSDID